MTHETTWADVDAYYETLFGADDMVLKSALKRSAEAGLPSIHVSPAQGKLLMLLAQSVGARAILEIGTLGGYSAIWLARALPPEGLLVTLEVNPKHAEVALLNIALANLADRVALHLGPALETLPRLEEEGHIFDMIFIDADKPSGAEYFEWALKLSRKGTLIIADNVVRAGRVIEADSDDASVQGTRRLNERIAAEPRVSAAVVQTVGSKGYDGFALIRVLE